jgi:hypothetical protein
VGQYRYHKAPAYPFPFGKIPFRSNS